MAELYETGDSREKVILGAVCTGDRQETEGSVNELSDLADTAGADTVGTVIQNLDKPVSGTYFGAGKIEEIKELAAETGADALICDDELSPAQMRNLEDALGFKVLDRTSLILDIFAKHATTREGKIQVELAQLKYRLTRLVGSYSAFSRLGGGIGTRGPGEKKLEVDRRLVKDRVARLEDELAEVVKNRQVTRSARERGGLPVVAIVGYTNAGKSTLLNHLTNAGVLEEDKLFATLDPTTRALTLESGQSVLMTDTVGFVRKLPHHLVEAFKSTLEEAVYSDIILHVVDSSSPEKDKHIKVVYETLAKLGVKDKPIITVFNKQDILREILADAERGANTAETAFAGSASDTNSTAFEVRASKMVPGGCGAQVSPECKDLTADICVKTSAKKGEGLKEMLDALDEILKKSRTYVETTIPYSEGGKLDKIRKYGHLEHEEYTDAGIYIKAYLPKDVCRQLF